MATRSFKVKLEGPPCSGKSTFMDLIIKKLRSKDIGINKVGEHILGVTTNTKAFPTGRKEKD